MNAEQFKERLSCYRPGIDDPEDELFAPALDATERDPELAEWLRDQQEFDAALRGRLQSASVPNGLFECLKKNVVERVAGLESTSIIDRGVAAETAATSSGGKIIRPALWKRIAAAAAAVVAGLFALNSLNRPASAVESFRSDMAKMATVGFPLDHESRSLVEVREWLASRQAPVYDECPPSIGAAKGVGCKTFRWNDHQVSVVCFEKDTGKIVHLFVIERAALLGADDVPNGKMETKHHEGLENCGWVDSTNVYLLVGSSSDVPVSDLQ